MFFLFFGLGCLLGLGYVFFRYLIPTIIWGTASLIPGIKGLIQAGKEGWEQGYHHKSPSGQKPA